jgi:hypothetical protein
MSITVKILIIGTIVLSLNAFSPQSSYSYSSLQQILLLRQAKFQFQLHVGRAVDQPLSATMISQDKRDTDKIENIMSSLETSYEVDPIPSRFTPLLGLYRSDL